MGAPSLPKPITDTDVIMCLQRETKLV